MDARTSGPTSLPLPAGWLPLDPPPVADLGAPPSVVSFRVSGSDGMPAWMYTVTGDVGNPVRRRLRNEQPKLDQTLRAAAAEPAGAVFLPWIEYGDPKAARPYLVCLRPGPTFADDLASGPLPAGQVVSTVLTCIDALHVLHRYGRAHGLLCPESLHHDGERVRLSAPLPPVLAELVATAGGTGHEPPEVLQGGEQNAAADVFALASTAWTLLAGRPPFGARDDQLGRLTAPEPPPLRRADVPAAMESALRAGLSPVAARRPDLRTLAQALHIVEDGAMPVSAAEPAPAQSVDPERQDTLAPTRPISESGQPLGSRYLLDALIGRGATGHVWRGHIRDSGSTVAVKLLRSELAEDPDVVTRFMRERSTLMLLSHPNLVAVRDLVAEGGALAIVMDLVEGQDLRNVLARGPMPLTEAAALLSQTALGLAAVHAAGIVHRDLKPENVLVERLADSSRARLTDFGLARAVESSVLTRATQLVGTPAYVAPEVVAGRPPGPPVDVYAFGITAYEALAGRRPFAGESAAAILRAHLDEAPQRPDSMPDPVWELIAACLHKDPQARPSAATLADAWQRVADGDEPGIVAAAAPAAPAAAPLPGTPAPDEPLLSTGGVQLTTAAQRPLAARHAAPAVVRKSRKKLWWAIAAIVVVGFGGGFGYAVLTKSPAPKKTHAVSTTGYPLQARIITSGQLPLVRWTLPSGLTTAGSVIVVYKVGNGKRTIIPPTLSGARTSLLAADLKVNDCVLVFAYKTTKAPPKGLSAKPACVAARKTSPSPSK